MAIAQERLRFVRDLHELIGLNLSAIALKGELAHRLLMNWSTAALPRTCVAGLAIATVLISAPGPIHSLHLAGGGLTRVCGVWLACDVRRPHPLT